MPSRVISVLDVKAGQSVHAVGGDRAHYQPIRSRLHPGSDPIDLARAFRDRLHRRAIYVADLDAIAGAPLRVDLYESIRTLGLHLWVDAGVRDSSALAPLVASGVSTIVVGLESVLGPAALAAIVAQVGPDRIVFSLDLRGGVPILAEGAEWGSRDALKLASLAMESGVRRLLLLDLARVGRGQGIGTVPLLARIHGDHPGVEISVGGGVAGVDDLVTLFRAGASNVLVGSALHDGRIGEEQLDSL
jgi:phosphoribosylformimino-5-aminoimidazole carboxamide ribotide isomerase